MRTHRTRWAVAPRNLARIGSVLAKSGKDNVVREDLIGSVCESRLIKLIKFRTETLERRRSPASTLYGNFRYRFPAANLYKRLKSDLKQAVTESSSTGGLWATASKSDSNCRP